MNTIAFISQHITSIVVYVIPVSVTLAFVCRAFVRTDVLKNHPSLHTASAIMFLLSLYISGVSSALFFAAQFPVLQVALAVISLAIFLVGIPSATICYMKNPDLEDPDLEDPDLE